jgi:tetratricopeptide (TPR) repeat protein
LRLREILTARSWSRWTGLVIVAIALLCLFPSVDRKVRIHYAEQALRDRKAQLSLEWLSGVPSSTSQGHKEFLTARAYRRLGEMNLVRDWLEAAHKEGFPVEILEREQWLAMAQSGQMREAEHHLRLLLQDPRDDGAEICEAYVSGYVRNHEVQRALPIVDAWQADFPTDPLPHVIRAGRFREMESWNEAVIAYRKALELRPEDTQVRLQLAICLKTSLKLKEAEFEFQTCLKETPEDQELLAEWGDMQLSDGRVSEAKSTFDRLLTIDPMNFAGRAAIGKIQLMNGNVNEARKVLGPLHEERPYDLKVLYSFASSLQAAGKTEEAAAQFQKVTEAEAALQMKRKLLDELGTCADSINQHFQIGQIAMKYESPDEGLRWLMKVIELAPGHVGAYDSLADYYKMVGNPGLEVKYRRLADSYREPKPAPDV